MRRQQGYSLIEMMIATGMLTVIATLSFVVLRSSNEAVSLATAKASVQGEIRDVISAITRDLEAAYIPVHVSQPSERVLAQDLVIAPSADECTFWIAATAGGAARAIEQGPIRVFHYNEDTNGNLELDAEEDLDGDGVLSRRVILDRAGTQTPMGGANHIDTLEFELLPSLNPSDQRLTRLRVRAVASMRHGLNDEHVVRSELESIVQLTNY